MHDKHSKTTTRLVGLPAVGSKVFGLTKHAEVPEEGALVKRRIPPDCVYLTTLKGDNIGNRWLDELTTNITGKPQPSKPRT